MIRYDTIKKRKLEFIRVETKKAYHIRNVLLKSLEIIKSE